MTIQELVNNLTRVQCAQVTVNHADNINHPRFSIMVKHEGVTYVFDLRTLKQHLETFSFEENFVMHMIGE